MPRPARLTRSARPPDEERRGRHRGAVRRWWAEVLALVCLAAMVGLGVGSMAGDAATVDEPAYIAAGYAYLHYGDYRLNEEHPPLMKALAAIPLQFMGLHFPAGQGEWGHAANAYGVGGQLLYTSGNNADQILFWARLPILLTAVGGGLFLFVYARRRFGRGAAAVAIVLYAFCTTLLAHARLVTMDAGVSVLILVALAVFAAFLRRPTTGRAAALAVALAMATLAKYSALLLYPLFTVLALAAILIPARTPRLHRLLALGGRLVGAAVASLALVYAVYLPLSWSTPRSFVRLQLLHDPTPARDVLGHLLVIRGFQPVVLIAHGALQSLHRTGSSASQTYLNGRIITGGDHLFFPLSFLFKTQVSLLVLIAVLPVAALLLRRRHPTRHAPGNGRGWDTIVLSSFVLTYAAMAVASSLNIGIRHILPIYPPLCVLVGAGVAATVRALSGRARYVAVSGVTVLLVWYAGAAVVAYPSYIPYTNELAGGPANAARWFADSNVDWGQDLRRLKAYVDAHPELGTVAVDYWGGGNVPYYFCTKKPTSPTTFDCSASRVTPWHVTNRPYPGRYLAVSASVLDNPVLSLKRSAALSRRPLLQTYDYLRHLTPVTRIGDSIYLYRLGGRT